jgi:hypothetical protein
MCHQDASPNRHSENKLMSVWVKLANFISSEAKALHSKAFASEL